MATKTDAYPDITIHPGEYLAEEIKAVVMLLSGERSLHGINATV
jgi:hypothetical protein